ncbi:MAG TPA: excisionase family DNA-binding protein [Acidimicrobiia bacterium]|nr:excisionase family DNA-binding protein [Acidimicrobiia bacterium]
MRNQSAERGPEVGDTAPGVLAEFLRRHPTPATRVMLVADDATGPTTITVPSEALKMFIEVLDHLKDGVGVSIVPQNAELTTQQAADLLGVSRPYLIDKVLEPNGSLEFRTVGRHRRIRFVDLDRYRKVDATRRKKAADRVTKISLDAELDD